MTGSIQEMLEALRAADLNLKLVQAGV